jgi:hypothetical protein
MNRVFKKIIDFIDKIIIVHNKREKDRKKSSHFHSSNFGTCELCKMGYWKLPNLFKKEYIYRLGEQKEEGIEIQEEITNSDFKIYGWVVMQRYQLKNNTWTNWMDSMNHKVYSNRQIALDAINQFLKCYSTWTNHSRNDMEFKVKPVYHLDKVATRNILIDELLKNKI